ncbi:AbrB/MazE/SpoVT family DNA-binding domain-containing protein [Hydrogenophaga sp.]|uniref:AbrB/MazE/SpoVT family DNA-binding domain-containing protein n=1 Tax=Hydrogenophaga sp. TaxID=1904254 RepID=UPI003AF53AF4
MHILKLIEAGESLAVVLPQDVLERLKLGDGDEVLLEETDGGFSLLKPMRPEQNAGA